MKKLHYMLKSFMITMIGVTVSAATAFAGQTSYISSYDSSYIDNFEGEIKTEKDVKREYQNVKTNAISNTTVFVDVPYVKNGKGDISLERNTNTSYNNVESVAITDVEVSISAPIIYGSSENIDVNSNHNSETKYHNTKAGYIYSYDYDYHSPVYIDNNYLEISQWQ